MNIRYCTHFFCSLFSSELIWIQVRISIVELYNEDLSDLMAAAEDESSGKLRRLRLLEDPKKGVVLQVAKVQKLITFPASVVAVFSCILQYLLYSNHRRALQ